jgi:hypothetical protein
MLFNFTIDYQQLDSGGAITSLTLLLAQNAKPVKLFE